MNAEQSYLYSDWIEPWPAGLRRRKPDGFWDSIELEVQVAESCEDARWGCLERDRDDFGRWRAQQLDLTTHEYRWPLRIVEQEVMRLAAETTDRFGYDFCRRFVAAVLRKDFADSEHAGLMANVECRFGRKGLLLFGGWLAVHYAAYDQWRERSA
jgi:hypothetical protein